LTPTAPGRSHRPLNRGENIIRPPPEADQAPQTPPISAPSAAMPPGAGPLSGTSARSGAELSCSRLGRFHKHPTRGFRAAAATARREYGRVEDHQYQPAPVKVASTDQARQRRPGIAHLTQGHQLSIRLSFANPGIGRVRQSEAAHIAVYGAVHPISDHHVLPCRTPAGRLSRPGARYPDCSWPVSPGRSANPACPPPAPSSPRFLPSGMVEDPGRDRAAPAFADESP